MIDVSVLVHRDLSMPLSRLAVSLLPCSNEDEGEGYVLTGEDIGLRLTAMSYWKCSEAGMKLSFMDKKEPDCKFVMAESLPGQGKVVHYFFCEG